MTEKSSHETQPCSQDRETAQAEIKRSGVSLSLNPADGSMKISLSGAHSPSFRLGETAFRTEQVRAEGDSLEFDGTDPASGWRFQVRCTIEDSPCACVRLQLHADSIPAEGFCYPPAAEVRPGDIGIYPYGEGVAFAADDPNAKIPERQILYGCNGSSMSFWGVLRGQAWLLTAVETNADACFLHQRDKNGLLQTQICWEPQKGEFGYDRVLRFCPGREGGITQACRCYRLLAEKKGLVKTLREKAKCVPSVDRLVGSADVWLWNDDAMEKLYSPGAAAGVPTREQLALRCKIAAEMKASGMDRVLWSVFDENVDPGTVQFIQNLGYLTSYYDIYTDVIPRNIADRIPETRRRRCEPRACCWPDGVAWNQKGEPVAAWALKGTDGSFYPQNRICDRAGYECAALRVPEHAAQTGLEGRFLDVVMGGAVECWNPAHPTTRTESIGWKRKQLGLIGRLGLVCGTEVGCEDGAAYFDYDEGMMSPPDYRARDSGRRMTDCYRSQEEIESFNRCMLNPKYRVPLWELVFHDCTVSYWYWGDASNCCPPLTWKRDLFDMLYGLPPIYSIRAGDWEEQKENILASYRRTSEIARAVGYARMLSFDYLSENLLVQQTTFDNGIRVVANFSDQPYSAEGTSVPPRNAQMFRDGFPGSA